MADIGRELTKDRGHRSSRRSREDDRPRRRSRSPHREERRRRDDDRERTAERSSRYAERSSRYDERERDRGDRDHGRDRDRDRDRRSSRYDDRERDRDRNFDRERGGRDRDRPRDRDRDRYARHDDAGGGRRRGGHGSVGGGGGFGNGGADGGVFGSPNIRRSPTPEGTIPISKRPRKYTAWDVKPPGYANVSAMEAKISGSFILPGQTRPASQTPGGPTNGANGNIPGSAVMNNGNFGMPPHVNPNHHWVNPNQQNLHPHAHMPVQHHNQFQMNAMARDGSFGMPGALPPIHFKPAQGQSGPVAQTQSFARQARRLYVGNILHTANEMNVAEFFNAKMKELGLLCRNNEDGMAISISENPVVAVQVNHEKNYAFVEFRNAEEATHGMSFDGIIFQNQALKIRRPKDYTGPDHAGPTHIPGVVSTNVPDSPNKIFIGGLPSYLTDDQVMELLKSFGELKSFNLVKDTSSGGHVSKGFAFCEYVDPDLTDIACQGLNGMELGDRYLVVQRAQIGQNAKKEKENNLDGTAQRNNYNQFNNFAGGQATAAASSVLAAVKNGEGEKTRILQMLNMVNQEELVDDQEYSEILEDIRDECGKYGKIENVKIPRPIKNEKGRIDAKASESVDGLGKVFVMFEKVEECTAALSAIAGRQFAGRVIICAYAPEDVMKEAVSAPTNGEAENPTEETSQ